MATDTFNDVIAGFARREGVNQTFVDITTATSGTFVATNASSTYVAFLQASTTTNQFQKLYRGYFTFDTSSLPDEATITSANLAIYTANKSNAIGTTDLIIVSANDIANSNSLVVGDYSKLGSVELGRKAYADVAINNYTIISLNSSGIGNINTTGVSEFGAMNEFDFNKSFSGTWLSGGAAGFTCRYNIGSGDPYLEVTYTTGLVTHNAIFYASNF